MLWIPCSESQPDEETTVLAIVRGEVRLAEIRWDHPTYEDTYKSYWYWDDPLNDGQDWQRENVTYWMPIPPVPVDIHVGDDDDIGEPNYEQGPKNA